MAFHAAPSSLSLLSNAVLAVQYSAIPVVALLALFDDIVADFAHEMVDDVVERRRLKVGIIHTHNLVH